MWLYGNILIKSSRSCKFILQKFLLLLFLLLPTFLFIPSFLPPFFLYLLSICFVCLCVHPSIHPTMYTVMCVTYMCMCVFREVCVLVYICLCMYVRTYIYGASQVALMIKNQPANAGNVRDRFDPWVRKILWRRAWQPIQYCCLENPTDRSLAGDHP